jgi:uncharacterized protein
MRCKAVGADAQYSSHLQRIGSHHSMTRSLRHEERLSAATVRRIALAAQGFAAQRPKRAAAGHLIRAASRIGVLQIDSVSAVCRSHYLPLLARTGPYPRDALDDLCWGKQRAFFEYWAHQASLLPVATFPFVRWRMDASQRWDWGALPRSTTPKTWLHRLDPALRLAPFALRAGMVRIGGQSPRLIDAVLALVAERGPLTAREAGAALPRRRVDDPGTGAMWNWNDVKIVLEWLFYMGRLTTATRRGFERVYDLTERILPPDVLSAPAPSRADGQRELMRIAARAQGVATERQLREYFHIPADEARQRIDELIDARELEPVRVEGFSQPMYRWHDAVEPERLTARALLSPFDSLIWDRDRMLRLFGFHYRISIYTRAEARTDGYYVMPFLLGDRLVARVDLRADRATSTLLAPSASREAGTDAHEVADALAAELRLMAAWLGLDDVRAGKRGDLARALSGALRR